MPENKLHRLLELHAKGTPFQEIVRTLDMAPEAAFLQCVFALANEFDLGEKPFGRRRPREAYEDLICAVTAFANAKKTFVVKEHAGSVGILTLGTHATGGKDCNADRPTQQQGLAALRKQITAEPQPEPPTMGTS